MTGREHKAQQVVTDVIVDRGVEIRHGYLLLGLELPTELLVLALEPLVSPQQVDRTMLRRSHEPGARIVRDARLRPPLERGDERILRELLGETDVAYDPREAGDESSRLDPPDRVDRAMGIGSRQDALCCADCACISGNLDAAFWTSAGKSENSCTWRTSITSLSDPGQRDAHSIASSFDFT